MSDLIGKIICGYRIVSQIGQGGMGKVYLGESAFLTEYKQQVAIKTLTSRGASEKTAAIMRDLFVREANIQVQLKHEHIVGVIQFAVEGDEYFLILEYLPGYNHQGRRMSNVADVITHEMGPIPPSLAFQWFTQTLEAMSYAHKFRYRWQGEERVGIVHRDIKPANLLVLDPKTIKVSDFGIVKVSQQGGSITRNLTPGTSAYMSPEAILGPSQYGLEQLDGRSDIYSLGVTLFEMLTGKLPFSPEKGTALDSSLRRQQVEAAPPLPSSILADLTPQIDAIVLKALEKHPNKRYQSAEEFKRAILDHEKKRLTVAIVPAQPAETPYETRPFFAAEGTEVLAQGKTSQPVAVSATRNLNDGLKTDGDGRDAFLTSANVAAASVWDGKRATAAQPRSRIYLWLIGVAGLLLVGAIVAVPLVNWIVSKRAAGTTTPTPGPDAKGSATPVPIPDGMAAIPGGTYLMGRDVTEEEKKFEVTVDGAAMKVFSYDYPAHEVEVKPFFLDKTEVSNRDYAQFVRATLHPPPLKWVGNEPPLNSESTPVTHVSLIDAIDFCGWRGKERKDGYNYRLPSEEEWEFAARGRDAGKPGRLNLYPWGEEWSLSRANTSEAKLGYPRGVTAYPAGASPFGVLNMAGNVYEWTATDFNHYPGSDQKTPHQKGNQGVYQVVRGGSFDFPKECAMTTTRVWANPTDRGPRMGFRCAADLRQ